MRLFEESISQTKKLGRPYRTFAENLPCLWPEGKGISSAKLKDVKPMMNLIPSDGKDFYKQFFPNNLILDDIDGFNGELDFDVEIEEEGR